MQKDLLFDIQTKVLGGYINAEECSINNSHIEILAVTLEETLFDNFVHKAIARACNRLKSDNIPITEYTVADFLEKFNIPNGSLQEAQYLQVMIETAVTPRSFKHYIEMIIAHKMDE